MYFDAFKAQTRQATSFDSSILYNCSFIVVHLISQNHTFFLSSSLPITRDTSHSRAPRNKETKTERIYVYIYAYSLTLAHVRSVFVLLLLLKSVCFPNLTTLSLFSLLSLSQQQHQEPRSRERERVKRKKERERERERRCSLFSLSFFLSSARCCSVCVCCFARVVVAMKA